MLSSGCFGPILSVWSIFIISGRIWSNLVTFNNLLLTRISSDYFRYFLVSFNHVQFDFFLITFGQILMIGFERISSLMKCISHFLFWTANLDRSATKKNFNLVLSSSFLNQKIFCSKKGLGRSTNFGFSNENLSNKLSQQGFLISLIANI